MSLLKYITLTSITIFLSACTSIDNVETVKNEALDKAPPTAWSTHIKQNIVGPKEWVQSFNDPLLTGLIEEGNASNLDLQVAAANMDKAWLLAKQSGVTLKPTIDLSLSHSHTSSVGGGNSTPSSGVGLQASWELDVWGRIQSGIDASSANAESLQADYIFAKHSLSANIAKSYFKVVEAKLQADITKKNVSILDKNLRISQVKYENGSTSAQDVALNKANLASAQEQLIATENSKRDGIRALEVLIGRYPSTTLDIGTALPILPSPPPLGTPSLLLERRPDLISAERQLAAAYKVTEQAKAAQLPNFSLTSSISGASESLSNVLNPSNLAWQLVGNILAPIYDGGRRKIDVEIASKEQTLALANYQKQALVAFSEVENNLDLSVSLAKREIALIEAYKQNQKAYKIAELRYKEGESELLDLLQIQQQTISAESSLLSIKRLQLEQRINLYLALGGKW